MLQLGEWLARNREEKGLSQKTLANRTHVSQALVSQWKGGKQEPSPEQQQLLSELSSQLGATVT